MTEEEQGPGAWPLHGMGPREGLRSGHAWPAARCAVDGSGPSRREIRSGRVRRSSYGLYVPADVQESIDQRIVEAAAVHRGGVVTGWAALRWMGARWFEVERTAVPIAVDIGHGRGGQSGLLLVNQEFLPPHEVMRVDGLRLTIPVRSVTFEMRRAESLVRAVQIADMACYDDIVSISEISRYCHQRLPIQTGVALVREALPLLRENAWSPREVVMRQLWESAVEGAALLCNAPVFTPSGVHLATPDLIDPVRGIYGEYDGGLHLAGSRRAADIRREGELRRAGLEGVTMVAEDVLDPRDFFARLAEAHRRAVSSDRAPGWTLTRPSWWVDTSTVAARRSLTRDQRRRLLRYRDVA